MYYFLYKDCKQIANSVDYASMVARAQTTLNEFPKSRITVRTGEHAFTERLFRKERIKRLNSTSHIEFKFRWVKSETLE